MLGRGPPPWPCLRQTGSETHRSVSLVQDLERALQQMLDAAVHELTTLLPDPLQPHREASKLADLHRFLDKLQGIKSKIQNLKAQPKQANKRQVKLVHVSGSCRLASGLMDMNLQLEPVVLMMSTN